MTRDLPRCGDTVLHRPTGEEWTVAWSEDDDLAWCGWPNGVARLAACELVKRASDSEHAEMVVKVSNSGDSRGYRVRRLYATVLEKASRLT